MQSVNGDDSIRSLHRPGAFPCLWSSTFVPALLDQSSFETGLVAERTAASSPCCLPSPSRLRFSFGKHMIRRSVTKISLPPNQGADYTCKIPFSPFATHLSGILSLPLLLSDSNTNFASPPSLPQSLPLPLLVSHYAVRSSFQTSMQSSSSSFASVQNDPLSSSWII